MAIVTAKLDPDPADNYTTQLCKKCNTNFKVDFTNAQGPKLPIAFCPYCGFQGQFWTLEQMLYLDRVASQYPAVPPPLNPDPGVGLVNKHQFGKCSKQHKDRIKYKGSQTDFFCIICGEKPA
jgi:hypothetical protein